MPSSELIRRLLLALVIAIAVAAGLWWAIESAEAGARGGGASERSTPERARAAEMIALPPGFPVGRCQTITLARDAVWVRSRGYAPVAEVRLGGGVRLIRGAPVPAGPDRPGVWRGVVVLPRTELADLDRQERAALLEVLRVWSGGVEIGTDRFRAAGVRFRRSELDQLLRWQR